MGKRICMLMCGLRVNKCNIVRANWDDFANVTHDESKEGPEIIILILPQKAAYATSRLST